MSYDTSKDPRILVGEIALAKWEAALKQKLGIRFKLTKKEISDLLSSMKSSLMELKHLYCSSESLVHMKPINRISSGAGMLWKAMEEGYAKERKESLLYATIRWSHKILTGLPKREVQRDSPLAAGVDLMAVKLRNISKVGEFWVTKVHDGQEDWKVVTNLSGLQAGMCIPLAFIPPADVGGIISEGMFISGQNLDIEPGEVLDHHSFDINPVNALLFQAGKGILKSH